MSYLRRISGLLLAGAALLSAAGCVWVFVNRDRYEAEALAVFQTGEAFYKKAEYDNAISSFSIVIQKYPRSELVDDAYYLASLSFAKRNDWEHAVGAAQKLESQFPKSPLIPKVQIVVAEGYEHLGLYVPALAAYFDTYLGSDNPTERKKAESQAKNLLGREQDYNVLTDLYANYKDTPVAEWLLYRLGSRAYEVEDFADAERYFAELRARFPHSPYIDKIGGREISAAALKGELVCGLLLPLSGSFSTYGHAVKEGVELAHSLKGTGTIHLEIYDTRSDPATAASGAETLIRKGAKIIIGPLTSAEVNATAKIAAKAGVVMISPTSTDPGLLSAYECLFQLNSYAESETREIARYAARHGIKKFGILYPEKEQAKTLADEFATTVRSEGGQVIYSYVLPDTVVQMKETLLRIRHQGAEAIFLPFDRQQLLSVVPQIAYYRMRVRILGLDDFADTEILRRGGVPFEGVWFAAPTKRLGNPMAFETFFAHYNRRYNKEPEWAATLGYDAYNFLYEGLSQGKDISLCQALRSLDDRQGILGRLLFLTNPSEPSVRIYTIHENEIKEIK
jgi:branched-chain amino acid transport system substrate-binding protein